MGYVVRDWHGYFRALQAYHRQSDAVRRRVATEYFDIASSILPDGGPQARLRMYGMRERQRLSHRSDAG